MVGTAPAGEMFIHVRTATLYFYQEDVERFVVRYVEAYISFLREKTTKVLPSPVKPSLLVDSLSYPADAIDRGWILQREAARLEPPGTATLELLLLYAPKNYPLSAQASFASRNGEIVKLRAEKPGPATPSHKTTVAALDALGTADAMAGGADSARVGPTVKHQLTRGVGLPFANLGQLQGSPRWPTPSLVSQPIHFTILRSASPYSILQPCLLQEHIK